MLSNVRPSPSAMAFRRSRASGSSSSAASTALRAPQQLLQRGLVEAAEHQDRAP